MVSSQTGEVILISVEIFISTVFLTSDEDVNKPYMRRREVLQTLRVVRLFLEQNETEAKRRFR